MEMTTWKAKLYDVTRKVDKLGSAEKRKSIGQRGRFTYTPGRNVGPR